MSKYYYLVGILVFLLGASGGYWLVKNSKQPIKTEPALEQTKGELKVENRDDLSPNLSPSPGERNLPSPGDGEGERERSILPTNQTLYQTPYSTPYQTPKAAAKPVDPCIEAKKIYDQEQDLIAKKLADLSLKRNAAINSYLTAIALATSKYNSATSTSAYTVYQQEQAQALANYTQTVNNLTSQEEALNQEKQASHFRLGSCS